MEDVTQHPNYCPMFFKGMYIEKKDSQYLAQGHCCASYLGQARSTIDFYHDDTFQRNRHGWRQSKITGCDACWLPESQGQHSFRIGYIEWLKNLGNDVDPLSPELFKLDYNVGPLCNAKCIHCTSHFSSAWAAEDQKFGVGAPVVFKDTSKFDIINQLDVKNLKTLYFNGGEPFMSSDPLTLLQRVKQQGNIAGLTYQTNTNGSCRPGDDLIKLWLECKSVDIFVSLDGTEKAFEYIRYPLKWPDVIDNIEFLSKIHDKIRVKISYALGSHNIDEVESTWNWFLDHRDQYNMDETAFGIHRCYGKLDLAYTSERIKQIWRSNLDPVGRWTDWIMTLLSTGDTQNDAVWVEWLQELDRRRNINWQQSLPRLWESYKKSQAV